MYPRKRRAPEPPEKPPSRQSRQEPRRKRRRKNREATARNERTETRKAATNSTNQRRNGHARIRTDWRANTHIRTRRTTVTSRTGRTAQIYEKTNGGKSSGNKWTVRIRSCLQKHIMRYFSTWGSSSFSDSKVLRRPRKAPLHGQPQHRRVRSAGIRTHCREHLRGCVLRGYVGCSPFPSP